MPSSVSCGAALFMDGPTYNGSIMRPQLVAGTFLNTPDAGPTQVFGGVLPSGGALRVSASSGMNVAVATGYALCPSSAGSTDGGYLFGMTTAATLTIAGADPTNPRIDVVCATASDVGSSSSAGLIQVITGTPAPSPVAPSLPSNSVALAQVAVAAGVSSITGGNITDKRVFTAAIGGIVPVPDLSHVPSGYTGMFVYDRSTGRLAHNPAAGPAQPHVLPFAPQISLKTTDTASVSATVTLCSVTVTTDGSTDIEMIARIPGIFMVSGAGGGYAVLTVAIDGTQVAQVETAPNPLADGFPRCGVGFTHVTSGAGSDRPSAGTHTVTLAFTPFYDGTHQLKVSGFTNYASMLYVRPVPL